MDLLGTSKMIFLAVLRNCIRWLNFLFSFPAFQTLSLHVVQYIRQVKILNFHSNPCKVSLFKKSYFANKECDKSMRQWWGQLGKKNQEIHSTKMEVFLFVECYCYFLGISLKKVVFISNCIYCSWCPVEFFFFSGTMLYAKDLCLVMQHGVQKCIYHFIHVLWTSSFYLHATLEKWHFWCC